MDADEREIYHYLKTWKEEFVSHREISRRAGGKHKYRDAQDWAIPALHRMVERGILESDNGTHYRIKPRPVSPDGNGKKKWISPQVAKILKDSGKDFSEAGTGDTEKELDDYYENL